MWKYRCKNQVLALGIAFLAGVLLMAFSLNGSSWQDMLAGVVPDEVIAVYTQNPVVLYLVGGVAFAGICNVFLIGNMLSSLMNLSPFFYFMIVMMFPNQLMMAGIVLLPVMLVISLYGWISLAMGNRGMMRSKNITNDDEIIRIYKIHHPLQEQYKDMALKARSTYQKIGWTYALGIVAVFCVMFFVENLFIALIAIFLYMMAFQYLSRARAQCLKPISDLLYNKCDPQACMSALIFWSERRKGHYKLTNQALMANCLIYMDDPNLAQDILITFPRPNASASMTYYSLMAYTYYMLRDEAGLERCKNAIAQLRPGMGAMGLMIKSQEEQAVANKLNLMNRDFNACKQYYLNAFKKSPVPLQKADSAYYIGLISFVQEDWPVAERYLEKAVQLGGSIYFVRNAKNYLAKIQEMGLDVLPEPAYPAAPSEY